MNIGLCAAFLEGDVWESRLRVATSLYKVDIVECNSAQALLPMLELKSFSFLVVVLNGVTGLEAVGQLRTKVPDVPLLWISDEDFSLAGYQYRVTYFLHRPVSDKELQAAVLGCLQLG